MFSSRFKHTKATFDRAKNIMKSVIERHLRAEESSPDFVHAYIDHVRQTGDPESSFFGEKGLQSLECVLVDLFMAGGETTATALLWAVLFLLHHPEQQESVRRELDALGENPKLDHFSSSLTPRTKAFIYESLRLASIVPVGIPHFVSSSGGEDVLVGDFSLPANATVFANLSYILRDGKVWCDPLEFKPERFLDDDGNFFHRRPDAFLPFSTGRRACPGRQLAEQQLFIFLARLIYR